MTDTAALPPDDDALVAELRRAGGLADPLPDGWREAAAASFAWAAIDAAPAGLAYDSRSARGGRGGVGSGPALRELRYTTGSLAVELELDIGADKLRVLGRVAPERPVAVMAMWPDGHREVVSDDDGTFRFDELPRRPLCLVVGGEHPVKTGWVVT